jgi:hypothetical protein
MHHLLTHITGLDMALSLLLLIGYLWWAPPEANHSAKKAGHERH